MLEPRDLGTTGLRVSALGLGCGRLGELDAGAAERLLDAAYGFGVRWFDTAPSYTGSEERLGRWARRHPEARIATKVGYGIPGVPDWTGPCVDAGIERARQRLGRATLDLVQLHSPPSELLWRPGVVEALERARARGQVRLIGYAGDNGPLAEAIASGRFAVAMASGNVCDQGSLRAPLGAAKARGMGWVAKRPLANAAWLQPNGGDGAFYAGRLTALGLDLGPDPAAAALRFVVWTWGVDIALVGTRSPAHLQAAVEAVAAGPLPSEQQARWRRLWDERAVGWPGLI